MVYEKEFEDLKNFRDVGEQFLYMGVNCVVTGHKGFVVHPFGGTIFPLLRYVYVDNHGVLHDREANMLEFEIIKKQNKPG